MADYVRRALHALRLTVRPPRAAADRDPGAASVHRVRGRRWRVGALPGGVAIAITLVGALTVATTAPRASRHAGAAALTPLIVTLSPGTGTHVTGSPQIDIQIDACSGNPIASASLVLNGGDVSGALYGYENSAGQGCEPYATTYVGTVTLVAGANSVATTVCDAGGRCASRSATYYNDAAPAPASVTISPSAVTMAQGATAQLTATVNNQFGQAMPGQSVTWASSNAAVASVAAGLVTGAAAGSATMTASAGSVSGTATVTVNAPAVSLPDVWGGRGATTSAGSWGAMPFRVANGSVSQTVGLSANCGGLSSCGVPGALALTPTRSPRSTSRTSSRRARRPVPTR